MSADRPSPLLLALRRLSALGVAALVLIGALTAGRSYVWCVMMERAVDACCCDPAHEDDEAPAGPEARAACCEDRALAGLDQGRLSAAPVELPDAAPAAISAAPGVVIEGAPAFPITPHAAARLRATPIRAGPSATDTCVRLQVFRC